MNQVRTYIYLGDRLTAPQFRGQVCQAVLNAEGKCICGRNGVMLVYFPHLYSRGTVLRRRLRKLDKYRCQQARKKLRAHQQAYGIDPQRQLNLDFENIPNQN